MKIENELLLAFIRRSKKKKVFLEWRLFFLPSSSCLECEVVLKLMVAGIPWSGRSHQTLTSKTVPKEWKRLSRQDLTIAFGQSHCHFCPVCRECYRFFHIWAAKNTLLYLYNCELYSSSVSVEKDLNSSTTLPMDLDSCRKTLHQC